MRVEHIVLVRDDLRPEFWIEALNDKGMLAGDYARAHVLGALQKAFDESGAKSVTFRARGLAVCGMVRG